jgi:lipoprotein-anchoring transpeptidase ErfK/SrfK
MAADTSRRRAATLTREQETRRNARAERQRRENSRLRRDRIVLALVLVAIAAGGAFALRPGSARAPSAADPGRQAESVPTGAVEATASFETTRATEQTASAPAPHTAEVTSTPAPIKPLSPAPRIKTIVVDKSEQTVTLYKADGKPVDRFQCASGEVYPRVGTYAVWGHAAQSWSLTDDTTFYYFTKFATSDKDNSIGFHSIPEEPDGTLVSGLGEPVSAGCVRLAKDKARFVYGWAVTGTRVVVKR